MLDILSDDLPLYRYYSYKRFRELLSKKTIYFSNPRKTWIDQEEDIVLRVILACQAGFSDVLFCSLSEEEIRAALKTSDAAIEIFQSLQFASCWCGSLPSNLMWSKYSDDNKCIRLKTTWNTLARCMSRCFPEPDYQLDMYNVEYREKNEIGGIIRGMITDTGFTFSEAMKIKLQQYHFEREVRAVVQPVKNFGEFINKGIAPRDYPVKFIPLGLSGKINDVFTEVCVHPDSTPGHKRKVQQISEHYKIHFRE